MNGCRVPALACCFLWILVVRLLPHQPTIVGLEPPSAGGVGATASATLKALASIKAMKVIKRFTLDLSLHCDPL